MYADEKIKKLIHEDMPFATRLGTIGRVLACLCAAQRSRNDGIVQDLPVPGDAAFLIIGADAIGANLFKDTARLPFLKPSVTRTARTKLGGKRLPLTAGAEAIDYATEYLAKRNNGACLPVQWWFGGQIFQIAQMQKV